jgi:glycerol-3-phosphate acyltransferase PlsY
MIDSWVAAVLGGYLLGSVPVAVLAGRARGFDPRQVGDQNPGFWNMKDQLGWAGAVPVLAGDTLKGTAAGLLGLVLARGLLGAAVICPPAFALGIALCAGVALFTRSFAVGARTGVFAVPFLQLIFAPALEVAATGALMSLIGVRFVMAALAARRRTGRPRPDSPRTEPAGPDSGGPATTAPAGSSRPSS